MGNFVQTRDRLKKAIDDRKLGTLIGIELGVSRTTIYRTFKVESKEQLKGDLYRVWEKSIELLERHKNTEQAAKAALDI